jgi:hypothetical protein
LKRGTPAHPKVAHLARLLNIEIFGAVGILEMLWQFAARFCPQGDIGKHTDAAIARAVGWEKRSGSRGVPTEVRLTSALVDAGFLDRCEFYRLVVHDWKDHCDQAVTKYLSRHGLDFVYPGIASHSHSQSHSSVKPLPDPPVRPKPPAAPEPEPDTQTPAPVAIIPAAIKDPDFHGLLGAFLSLGVAISETDRRKCAMLWVSLDTPAKQAAATYAAVNARGEWSRRTEQFVPRPWNYLTEKQWERKAVAKGRDRPMSKAEAGFTEGARMFMEGNKK